MAGGIRGLLVAALLLPGAAHAETVRASRLAMGTVVGVSVVSDTDMALVLEAIDAAYAAIEVGEAELSEWRPGSVTSRLADTGGPVSLSPAAEALFRWCDTLRDTSGGAFDVSWRATPRARFLWGPEGLRVAPAPTRIDLGGVLKGFLADRAADALRAHGVDDFLVDAAGDIVAAGDAEGAGLAGGWLVDVAGAGGRVATVRLHDAALSTSGNAGQPGHIHDAVTGASIEGARVVSVVAPSGMVADGLATALYAGGWRDGLAEAHGAYVLEVDGEGRRRFSKGARRVFR